MMQCNWRPLAIAALGLCALGATAQGLRPTLPLGPEASARTADFIVAVVNSEPITNSQVRAEVSRIGGQLAQRQQRQPDPRELNELVLERLINDRVQLQTARTLGIKVEDSAVDDAELSVARQNQLSLAEMHKRLAADGLDRAEFRAQLRDQVMLYRLREREVLQRVKVSDAEVDQYLRERQQASANEASEIDLAHILVSLPDEPSAAQVAAAKAKADELMARARKDPDFARLARENSNAPDAAAGGQFGMRPADRYPTLFADAARDMAVGDLVVVRSGAGFHVLKLLDKRSAGMPSTQVRQTRASHILLRLSADLSESAAIERLQGIRQRIAAGQADFESVAKEVSQDGSARQGGDLGWMGPGAFVPEFEDVMNTLPIGQLSEPFASRFGVHLMVVKERRTVPMTARQTREAVRGILREKKQDEAYANWAQDLRGKAYVEMRQAPGG